jgi:glutamate carboxypeptidase
VEELLNKAEARLPQMIEELKTLVEIESPSDSPSNVNNLATYLQKRLDGLGVKTSRVGVEQGGDVLMGHYGGEGNSIMILGHMDTVWPLGTLAKRPTRIEGDKLFGIGSYDMKAGLVVALHTLEVLQALNKTPKHPLVFFFSSLEETDCEPYQPVLEKTARLCDYVLDLEPAWPGGAVKTERKGCANYVLNIKGRAAHAGADPRKGISAITELAHQIQTLNGFTDYEKGTTVNVGVINGGTRPNVVAEAARAEIDVRFCRLVDGKEIDSKIKALKPYLLDAEIEISGKIGMPPLERTEKVVDLYQKAKEVANKLGFDLGEVSTGGVSEACITSALGVPTLDGLGADGDGAHAEYEHVLLPSLATRTALLAGLLQEL